MSISIGEIIVWLIIGALAGTLAGRLVTFTKRGFGFWVNIGGRNAWLTGWRIPTPAVPHRLRSWRDKDHV